MGFLVGVATAFFVSLGNTQLRRLSGVDTYVINWLRFSASAVVLAILVSIFAGWHYAPPVFWLLVAISVPIELLIGVCYVRAFQHSPQSLVGPLFSLSAIFLVPLSYFLNGELPSLLGFLGIVSALGGALALGWDFSNPGMRKAVMRIFSERGAYYMLGAAALAGVAVAIIKYAYNYASPVVFAFYVLLGLALVHTAIALRKSFEGLRGRWREAAMMMGAFAISQPLHYIGVGLLLSAYFISIKRLSTVFDVILGRLVGKETHLRERMVGALLMVAGVVLIALG